MEKVSVIIPTHNRRDFLREALGSVLAQDYGDLEVIVVDDASEDDTADVVAGFGDPRVFYRRHAQNLGEAASRNTGFLVASGDYVAFLDDDDSWLPHKLRLQLELFDRLARHTGLVYCGETAYEHLSFKTVSQRVPVHRGDVWSAIQRENIVGGPSTVVLRKDCVDKIGLFDTTIAYGLDYDYWLRVSRVFQVDFVPDPLVRYRLHPENLSKSYDLRIRGARDMARKYGYWFVARNRYYRSFFWELGMEQWAKGASRKATESFWLSIKYHPISARSYLFLGLSWLGPNLYRTVKRVKGRLSLSKTLLH